MWVLPETPPAESQSSEWYLQAFVSRHHSTASGPFCTCHKVSFGERPQSKVVKSKPRGKNALLPDGCVLLTRTLNSSPYIRAPSSPQSVPTSSTSPKSLWFVCYICLGLLISVKWLFLYLFFLITWMSLSSLIKSWLISLWSRFACKFPAFLHKKQQIFFSDFPVLFTRVGLSLNLVPTEFVMEQEKGKGWCCKMSVWRRDGLK